MNSFIQAHRRLAAMALIGSGEKVTQRVLAARLDISLGLANKLLREMQDERLLRVNDDGAARYEVTPAGQRQQRAYALEFAGGCADLLDDLRAEVGRRAGELRAARNRRVLLSGSGVLADMAAAALANAGMAVAVLLAAGEGDRAKGSTNLRTVGPASSDRYDIALGVTAADAAALRKRLGRGAKVEVLLPARGGTARGD